VEIQGHAFLTSALYGDEWPASRPGRFTTSTSQSQSTWIIVSAVIIALLTPDYTHRAPGPTAPAFNMSILFIEKGANFGYEISFPYYPAG